MGFLTSFFSAGPRQRDLPIVFTKIAKDLACLRGVWFEECVAFLEGLAKSHPDMRIRIANRSLGGEADLAIKACQVFFALAFLEAMSYLPRASKMDTEDMVDAFYVCIAGGDLSETAARTKQYEEQRAGAISPGFQLAFAFDVARHISASDAPLQEAIPLQGMLPPLVVMTKVVVADAFGDRATVQELRATLREQG